jgi:hypothetical protein
MNRSLSSASGVSQQFTAPSTPGKGIARYVEHSSTQAGSMNDDETTPANQRRNLHSPYDPPLVTEAHRQLIDHQRLQTEYLSQVLYNDMSLVNTNPVLDALPVGATPYGKLRALEASRTAFHVCNATAPVASTDMQSLLGSTAPRSSHLSTPLPVHSTLSDGHLRAQSMVRLRGGGDKPTSASRQDWYDVIRDTHLRYTSQSDRQYMKMYDWAMHSCHQPAWKVPISSGDWYEVFLSTLPSDIDEFLPLFGPLYLATHWTSPLANARREFYHKLGRDRQYLFKGMIMARRDELSAIERGGTDPQIHSRDPNTPRLMLYHLMEATEPSFNPGPSYFSSLADREAYIRISWLEMRNLGSRAACASVRLLWGYAAYLVIIESPTQC